MVPDPPIVDQKKPAHPRKTLFYYYNPGHFPKGKKGKIKNTETSQHQITPKMKEDPKENKWSHGNKNKKRHQDKISGECITVPQPWMKIGKFSFVYWISEPEGRSTFRSSQLPLARTDRLYLTPCQQTDSQWTRQEIRPPNINQPSPHKLCEMSKELFQYQLPPKNKSTTTKCNNDPNDSKQLATVDTDDL